MFKIGSQKKKIKFVICIHRCTVSYVYIINVIYEYGTCLKRTKKIKNKIAPLYTIDK